MTFYLNDAAQAIIDRHEAQDRERAHANKARIAQVHDIRAQENAILHDLRHLKEHHYFPGNNGAAKGKPQDAQAKAQIAEFERQLSRFEKQRKALENAKPSPMLTSARILAELDRFSNIELAPVERPTLALTKGERSLVDALQRFRGDVAALHSERKRIEKAPLRASDAKEMAREVVKRLATRGIPKVMGLFSGGEIAWPRVASASNGGRYVDQTIDGATLLAFLFQDQLIEKLNELIEFNAEAFESPLSVLDRTKQLRELDARIDKAERVEAAAVESLVAEGNAVSHRPDISVLAVLSYARK